MKKRAALVFFLLIVVVSLLSLPTPTAAQSSAIYWKRWDVEISAVDINANRFHVRETHVLVAAGRSFNGGDRQILLDRLTGITNIAVAENGKPYRVVNRSTSGCNELGIACLSISDNNRQVIYYNFFQQARQGQERTVTIDYDVSGALRSYSGGDQLFWVALVDDRPAEILASQITVTMPNGLPIDKFTSYPDNWTATQTGNVLIFTAPGVVPVGQEVEVRVQYPHNAQMAAPGWQAGFDLEVALMPILTLAGLILGLFIAIGGAVWTLMKLAGFRRGIQPPVVPDYLTEPPSDLPPGAAGTLIDGSADTKDVMATLLDLSRRGYITIEQVDEPGIFGKKVNFTFHRGDAAGKLLTHEQTMMAGLFKWSQVSVDLDDLKNKFYTTVNKIKTQLNAEMVNFGFYRRGPSDIFMRWLMGGIMLIVLGGVGGAAILAGDNIPALARPLLFVFGGVGFLGTVWAVFSRAMVTRTAAGQLEYVKWNAFRKYLDNIERYTQLAEAKDLFEKYIGYAIAFGLEKEWMRKFAPVLTSMPTWYHYAPSYGRWGSRGTSWEGGGGRLGDLSGGGGLNQMSGNLSQGLAAMSGGLTSLLNTASAVMTSQPSSSGSGGGFSGGGGGGGGSGGGSAGFH